MKPRGGKRKGAGRKKGFAALEAEAARRVIAEMVSQELRPIIRVLIAKSKKGDVWAIKELFNRAWGQAPMPVDVDLNKNGPLIIQVAPEIIEKNKLR